MPFGTVTLNDGNKMPTIAFGSGSVWRGHEVSQYVEQAIEEGFEHLDTAAMYENEDSVGTGIRESGLAREELFITTKFSGGVVMKSVNESLAKIGVKYVDLYLVHGPAWVEKSVEYTWKQFEGIKKAGLARSIGVSNFNVEQLQDLIAKADVVPAVNQISLNPYNYAENKDLLAFASKHGIVIEAFSSLVPITRTPGGPVDVPVAAAAQRLGVKPSQIILKWVRSKGVVIVTTSSSKAHLREYLAVEDLPPLTEDEIAAIEEAGAKGAPSEGLSKSLRLMKQNWLGLGMVYVCAALLWVCWRNAL